ncbi:FecR family protein [Acetobacter senegalensis]|uniref:FecR family protein n=1 Tax=Acetobacter senegalensis TaxID=446692 RepID=UPI00264B755D|nr:FecR domain-containing protein [Acetobacter senegalensis]MDN7354362.1 FecR domain-containing protein [Acetobacter senegalensis]
MTERKTPAHAAAAWYLFLREDPNDEDLKRRFREWLASDPAHAQAWADMNETASVMAAVGSPSRALARPPRPRSFVRQKYARFAAKKLLPGCALALAAAFAALTFITPDMIVRLRADSYAPVSETRHIHLDDGSEVILAPRAAVSITMNASERRIRLLQGEALFQVHHEAARPFRVTAGDVTVTDIGTVFDVQTKSNTTTVAVQEGRVHVASRRSGVVDRDLSAGEWERISTGDVTRGMVPSAVVGAWRGGTLIARNDTIADLVAALRPWTATKIILADHTLSQKRVTGTYDLHQPEASLRLIVDAYGGKVSSLMSWVDIVTGP